MDLSRCGGPRMMTLQKKLYYPSSLSKIVSQVLKRDNIRPSKGVVIRQVMGQNLDLEEHDNHWRK
jgi:hypothetical protein